MEYDKIDYTRYYTKNRHTYNDVMTSDGVLDKGEAEGFSEHEIEYVKSEKRASSKRHKRGDKGKEPKPHRVLGGILSVLIVVIVCGVFVLVADTIKGGYIVSQIESALSSKAHIERMYYGVQIRTFDDIENARVYSNHIRSQGGAGYVVYDEGYRVLVEVYDSEEDATNIAKNLKLDGENSKVYPFIIKEIDYLRFPDKTRNAIKSTLGYTDTIYAKLYEIGTDLAKKNIDDNTAKMRIKGVKDEVHNIIAEFTANMDDKASNASIIKVRAHLVSIEGVLDNLSSDRVKRPNLIADIRYTSCFIINSYRELCAEFGKGD